MHNREAVNTGSIDQLTGRPYRIGDTWLRRFTPRTMAAASYDLYGLDLVAADQVADAVPAGELGRSWLRDAVRDAVIYGLPAVLQYADLWRNVLAEGSSRAFQTWQHNRQLAGPDFDDFLTPNVDTLYSNAWLDLTGGPVELQIPEMGDRYYTVNLLDAYCNAVNLSTRTVGPAGGSFLIIPPNWSGEVPEDRVTLRVSTMYQWVLLRIFVRSADDVPNVTDLQDKFEIRRQNLDGAEIAEKPEPSWPMAPVDQAWSGTAVLVLLDAVLRNNGYPIQEEALLARFHAICVGAERPIDPDSWSSEMHDLVEKGFTDAMALVDGAIALRGRPAGNSGWRIVSPGSYGYNYLSRAAANFAGLGGTSRDESGPYTTHRDEGGHQLDGSEASYRMNFNPPPVDAFWSLTVYDSASRRLVENTIDRHVINSVTDDLPWKPDGSLDIVVGVHPGPSGTVWLPAPPAPFYIVLRAYLGGAAVADGSWAPCPVERELVRRDDSTAP